MNRLDDVTAVILAGGKGRRFDGLDKGLIEFNGQAIIGHILQQISPQVGAVMINANRNLENYRQYGYPVIADQLEDFQGPLAGFAIGMQKATTPYILTAPCDGPFIAKDYAYRLLQALNDQQAELAVAHDGERLQPVHAMIRCDLLGDLITFLQSGERKIDRWYAMHSMAEVDFSDTPEVFQNINSAKDHAVLQAGLMESQ